MIMFWCVLLGLIKFVLLPLLDFLCEAGKNVLCGDYDPGTRSIGGWLGPRVSLDAVEYRKVSCPCRESN
jgi:hypothetical protein